MGDVNPLVKVIIVSAYSDMANIRTAMNRGAYDFLTKPLDFQDLEATLSKTLKHVAEARQMMRSIEENALLRMFVQSTVLERLRPLTQGPGALAGEQAGGHGGLPAPPGLHLAGPPAPCRTPSSSASTTTSRSSSPS